MKQKLRIDSSFPITTREVVAAIKRDKPLTMRRAMIHFHWVVPGKITDMVHLTCYNRPIIINGLIEAGIIQSNTKSDIIGFRDYFVSGKELGVLVHLDDYVPSEANMSQCNPKSPYTRGF